MKNLEDIEDIYSGSSRDEGIRGEIAGTCPDCGHPLVWRKATKTGELYRGCPNFDGGCRHQERSY